MLKDNKLRLGVTKPNKFRIPEDYPLLGNGYIDESGNKIAKFTLCRWFTNLEHNKRIDRYEYNSSYYKNPSLYPKYDNMDGIEVSKSSLIPCDYAGLMGVPISFMDKYNPEDFEIVGLDVDLKKTNGKDRFYLNGKRLYVRIAIRNRGVVDDRGNR